MSLSTQVLIGLLLGILLGVLVGEYAGSLQVVGDVFIMLLQMTVLPYMTVSLISGVGRLSYDEGRTMLLRGGVVLVGLWALTLAIAMAVPLAFPHWDSAAFFSTSLVEEPPPIDFLRLYIPANPFYALANTLVPAVVLFSIALGVALIGSANKGPLLRALDVIAEALMAVTGFVARLAPYGVFALTAAASGTMAFDEVGRIQVYLVTYALLTVLMTFWLLPRLVTILTPLRYRDIVGRSRDALITAFATGSLLIILPILAEQSKRLLAESLAKDEAARSSVDVLVPASYNFPSAGKLMSLSFVPFAAWFVGSEFTLAQYPAFVLTGFVSFFGQTVTAVPFLLDMMRLPPDMFQLFVTVDVIASRFGVALSAMHTLAIALLATCAIRGKVQIHWRPLGRFLGLSAALLVATLAAARGFFELALENNYRRDQVLAEMHLLREDVLATVHREPPPPPSPDLAALPALERIRALATIRVGYLPLNLPWSHFNEQENLAGFDIEMAYSLARDLEVGLEFVPIETAKLRDALDTGYCDVIMAGLELTVERAKEVAFTRPYLSETMAIIALSHQRSRFGTAEAIASLDESVRLAVRPERYYLDRLAEIISDASLIAIDSYEEYFEAAPGQYDALVAPAETGSAWTLLYPRYSVVVPKGPRIEAPLAYAVSQQSPDLLQLLNAWLELKERDGTIQDNHDYWVRGIDAEQSGPRWSVIRNVLGWVE
ncbi:MAG: cation:dicarboxylase symporter family transporter [Myxococcota bacterium]|nr:cation:dicarboxylase symporter family transporter [Myxococcota bacterium]